MNINTRFPTGAPTDNVYLNSLIWGGSWAAGANQSITLKWTADWGGFEYEFNEIWTNAWDDYALTALNSAFQKWGDVCNVSFVYVPSAGWSDVDLVEFTVNSRDMEWVAGSQALALHEVPDGSYLVPLFGFFNFEGTGWSSTGLGEGGYAYSTIVHEIGHGLGLAHPHDGGTRPDATTFPEGGFGIYGLYDLDQTIWTVMSYNDGWIDVPSPDPDVDSSYGNVAGPMAFDIAAIQYIYGANNSYNTGSDTYSLPTTNTAGTFWECLWDAGGSQDAISAATSHIACTIDLNAAPLTGENAGGYVSHVDGIVGGFTIAHNVTIENAVGGSANDLILGNNANNSLAGGAGVDTAVFSSNLYNYTITRTGNTYIVRDNTGQDGTDTLSNIELLEFDDKTVNLTIQSMAASAPLADVQRLIELYVAFFNRVPDADGLGFWIGQMNSGQGINQIAESFYNAGVQYSNLTGFSPTMSNSAFVNVVYKNVLGRGAGADAEGLAYWSAALASGSESHGSLVSSILDSAHTFKGDLTWGWIADLLDNKIDVAKKFAVDWGLNYNSPGESITRGMAIAAAVTPTNTTDAIALIGVSGTELHLA